MRNYETLVVLAPDMAQEDRDTLLTKLKGIITKKGTIVKEEDWGKRKLAYPIAHKEFGFYSWYLYEAAESTVHQLELEMNLQPDILRYLSLVVEDVAQYLPKPKEEAPAGVADGVVQ